MGKFWRTVCGFGLELELHGKLFYVHWADTVEDLCNFILKIDDVARKR